MDKGWIISPPLSPTVAAALANYHNETVEIAFVINLKGFHMVQRVVLLNKIS